MNTFDNAVYHSINHFAGHLPVIDFLMKFFAQYALELYGVLFVIAWFILPKTEEKRRHTLIVSFAAGVIALLLNVIISHIWYRPRPFVSLPKGSFNQIIPHPNDASFPSDHGSGSFAFAAATWGRRCQDWVSVSFTVLAFIVAISRVYCGVHWPTDIIASFVVGNIAARIAWRYSRFLEPVSLIAVKWFTFGKSKKPDQSI